MAISSILRYSLLIMALVGFLALGVNSCAAPEETKTDAAATATSSDSSDDNSSSTDELSTTLSYYVKGFVQKGPFVQGTEITARELDPTLTPTGRTFTGTIEDNTGRFTAKGNLVHSIVELAANGYYFNEVAGSLSNSALTLQALAGLAVGTSVKVNLMTHLERKRGEELLDSFTTGTTFIEAKSQAQSEIMKIFNIENEKIT